MADVLPPAPIGTPLTAYAWADWYEKVRRVINAAATVDLASAQVTGILPVSHGGTGDATPTPAAGANIVITGTWPNNTYAVTAGLSGITTFSSTGIMTLNSSQLNSSLLTVAGGITLTGTQINFNVGAGIAAEMVNRTGGGFDIYTNNASVLAMRITAAGALELTGSTTLIKSNTTLANGAAAAAGTLGNAPAAGNPTKWIPINDNGTIRYIPTW